MSRREERGSDDSKRHRSRFDREPSPKKSRRDGKPETERRTIDTELDKEKSDRDQRHHRRLQDALPLEAPSSGNSKVETGNLSKESEDKSNGHQRGGTKHSSDPTKNPRSGSYFQHDDRGSAGQNGRSFSGRTDRERGWWRDSKEQQYDKAEDKAVAGDTRRKDDKANDSRDENGAWRHDGFFEMEANPKPPGRKRPSFREQKIPADPEKDVKSVADKVTPKAQHHVAENGRGDDRGHASRHSEKPERDKSKTEAWKSNYSSRDGYRHGAGSRYRGGDRFTSRQAYRPTGSRVEKWKHDLYEETSKSPPKKNEEDQISKIEALLSS